jgi:NAD(P)-dependent dehydrogenase (short-subunit alcohol dehydrogenase family)
MRASAGDRAAGVEGRGGHRGRYRHRPRGGGPAPNPTGRVAALSELAAFVTFLLSDEAAFITGGALAIDGGATA